MHKGPLIAIALSFCLADAIGLQHGVFRSQSTQGPQWMGNASIKKEEFNITVYPDYLDVQLDWEIEVTGTEPASFKNALEIVGNINLEANSTVVGMLLWNGDKILKAKLKTKEQARKEYEDVVDRSSAAPQNPRDPVILEWVRQDNYDISIFPVTWNGFRKLRMRYLVPSVDGRMGFPHAFSSMAKVTFHKGTGIKGFDLTTSKSDGPKIFLEKSVSLDRLDYEFQAYSYAGGIQIRTVSPILEDSSQGSRLYIGGFFGNGFAGNAVRAVYRQPSGLLEGIDPGAAIPSIYATLYGESDSCRKSISPHEGKSGIREELKIMTRGPLDGTLKWSVFVEGVLQKEITEKPKIISMEDGIQYARSFGNIRFYPMAKTMPYSLGSSLGFIDIKYALVALEEDVLPAITADKYLLTGVPTLNAEDIFPAKDDTAISTNAWSEARGYNPEDLLRPSGPKVLNLLTGLPQGMRYSLRDGKLFIHLDRDLLEQENSLGISIYSIKGKQVKSWGSEEITRGEFSWSPSESRLSSGAYVLKVSTRAGQYSQTVFLR